MKERLASVERRTNETDIEVSLNLSGRSPIEIATGVPFFDHLLHAMCYHGGFGLRIAGKGDVEVDPHHLVEDVGLVLGQVFGRVPDEFGPVARFGHAVIPMDDALSEAMIDVCGRPYLVYRADYPQPSAGSFDMSLLREFFLGLSGSARINLHLWCRYGENSHHMAEALFKALGKALAAAYAAADASGPLSTKGRLS